MIGKKHARGETSRRGRSTRLSRLVPELARSAWRSRGFAQESVIARWREIVGEELAGRTLPLRLRFARGERSEGTIEVRAEPAFAPELQHLAPRLLDRINAYFGYRAVARMRILQGPVQPIRPAAPATPAHPPDPEARSRAQAMAARLGDERLRDLLAAWGAEILTRENEKDDPEKFDSPSAGTPR